MADTANQRLLLIEAVCRPPGAQPANHVLAKTFIQAVERVVLAAPDRLRKLIVGLSLREVKFVKPEHSGGRQRTSIRISVNLAVLEPLREYISELFGHQGYLELRDAAWQRLNGGHAWGWVGNNPLGYHCYEVSCPWIINPAVLACELTQKGYGVAQVLPLPSCEGGACARLGRFLVVAQPCTERLNQPTIDLPRGQQLKVFRSQRDPCNLVDPIGTMKRSAGTLPPAAPAYK